MALGDPAAGSHAGCGVPGGSASGQAGWAWGRARRGAPVIGARDSDASRRSGLHDPSRGGAAAGDARGGPAGEGMHERTLHLHSMLVHAVIAPVPVAAVAFVLASGGVRLGGFATEAWRFLVGASLAVVLVVALPATVSGVLERGHHYATWHRTHRLKLVISLVLVAMVAGEIVGMLGGAAWPALDSPLGALVVVGNPIVAFALSALGLKMSLGRQTLSRTSYTPDLQQSPPVDVLAANAVALGEPPDLIDVLREIDA